MPHWTFERLYSCTYYTKPDLLQSWHDLFSCFTTNENCEGRRFVVCIFCSKSSTFLKQYDWSNRLCFHLSSNKSLPLIGYWHKSKKLTRVSFGGKIEVIRKTKYMGCCGILFILTYKY